MVYAELWGKFHKMDRNDESRLSRKEFVDGQRIFGFGLSRERATEVFKELDADDSGSIRFEEFVQWVIARMKEQGKRVAPVAPPPAEHLDGADGPSAFDRFYNERRLRELQRIRAGGELANGWNNTPEARSRRPRTASTTSSVASHRYRSDSDPQLSRTWLSNSKRDSRQQSAGVPAHAALRGGGPELYLSFTPANESVLRTTVDPETPEGRLQKAAIKPVVRPKQHMVFTEDRGNKVALWPGQYHRTDVLQRRGEIKLQRPATRELPDAIRLSSKTNGVIREKRTPFTPAGRNVSANYGRPSTAGGSSDGGSFRMEESSWLSSASMYSDAGNDHPSFSGAGPAGIHGFSGFHGFYGVPVARDIAEERSGLRSSQTPPVEGAAGGPESWLAGISGHGGGRGGLSMQLSEGELDTNSRAIGLPDRRTTSYVDVLGQRPLYPDRTGYVSLGSGGGKAHFDEHDRTIAAEMLERQVLDHRLAKKVQKRDQRKWRAKIADNRAGLRATHCERQVSALEAALRRGEPAAKARARSSTRQSLWAA